MRVVARRARIVQHDLVIGSTPNHARGSAVELMLRLASAGVGNFQLSHTGIES
jgi:hypothetical protein